MPAQGVHPGRPMRQTENEKGGARELSAATGAWRGVPLSAGGVSRATVAMGRPVAGNAGVSSGNGPRWHSRQQCSEECA